MKNRYTLLSLGFSLICLSMASCQKNSSTLHPLATDTSTTMAKMSVLTYRLASDISSVSESGLAMLTKEGTQYIPAENKIGVTKVQASGSSFTIPSHFIGFFGDSVTYTPAGMNTPGIIVSDFGPAAAGKLRSGKLTNYFYHKFSDIGFKDSVSFQKYELFGYMLNGSIVMTRLSASSFRRTFNISYSAGGPIYKYAATGIRYYSINIVRAQDMAISSVTYSETGSMSGKNAAGGLSVTGNIVKPLQYSSACAITGSIVPVAGTIDVSSPISPTHATIDFGNGSCDLLISINIGGSIKVINLADLAHMHL